MKTDKVIPAVKRRDVSRVNAVKRSILSYVLISLALQPMVVNAQLIAAGSTATRVELAPNGVPLVQIAAPNGAGVSHNQYGQFNVGPQGVILNNSTGIVSSQLAGYIDGNGNLGGAPARLILNEVTGSQPSALRGFMEIAGQRADLVIANPNGISCDGCGFINTARSTLTTGSPILGPGGSLDAFRVVAGQISIEGAGLNGRSLDQIDLLARAIQVGGGLWAPNINVVAGSNHISHDKLLTQTIGGRGTAPAYAIDIALLGGMYAEKIRLLANEVGVGVNSQGKLLAQNGDFQLDAAGRITLGGQINAARQVSIQSTHDIEHSGSTQANGAIDIGSQGTLSHTGTIAAGNTLSLSGNRILSQGNLGAGIDADGRATQAGDLNARASTTLQASGIHLAGGNIDLQANNLDLSHSQLQSGAQLTLQASGTVSTAQAVLQSGGRLTVNTQNLSNIDGQIQAAEAAITLSGTFDNQGGQVISQGPLNLTANRLDNRNGVIRAQGGSAGSLDIAIADTLDNRSQGRIESTGDSRLQSAMLNNSGKIISDTRLTLSSNTVTNPGILQADKLSLNAGQIDNPGSITGLTHADIQAATRLNNTGGTLQAGNELRIDSPVLDNTGGTLRGLQDIQLTSAQIDNSSGQINAARDLRIRTSNLGSGTYSAQRDLSLQVDTDYTHDASRRLLADRDLTLSVNGQLNHQGRLIAPRQLTLQATDIVTAPLSEILSETLTLQSDSVTHRGTLIAATQTLRTGQFNNTGSLFGQHITLAANSLNNRDTGVIAAGTQLDLHIRDKLDNQDGALIYSAGTLNMAADGQRDSNNRLLNPTSHIRNRSASIEAQGDMEIVAGTLDNTRTSVTAGSETLATRISLIQLKDGSWSSGVIGNAYLNGNTLLIETEKRSCDLQGQNCTTTRESTQESVSFFTTPDRLGVRTTSPVQECDSSGCRMVSTTTSTSVQAFGAETWHIDPKGSQTFSIQELPYDGRRMAVISEDRRETLSATPESRILAGGDLILRAGTVNNLSSRIEAGGDLLASIDTLNNTGLSLKTFTRDTHWVGACADIKGASAGYLGYCASGWIWTADVRDTVTGTNVSADAVFRGNRNLAINARQIDNRTLNAQGLVPGGINAVSSSDLAGPAPFAFTLPTNGLYIRHSEPSARYLVETDPRFTQYASFISSDYMLSRLGLDPAATQKRLGDGFYEQQLVRNQLIAQRGNTAQGAYPDLNAQYQALLEAGAAYAQAFSLVPGITLTQTQIAQLHQDMVWLETRVVEGQQVLVPVVYLAQRSETRDTGAVIAAGRNATLTATDLANTGGQLVAGQALDVVAANNLSNDSGVIRAQDIALSAGNDLRIGTATTAVELYAGQTYTHTGQAGSVSGQTLTLTAGRDLTLAGANVTADTARLAAGRDLVIGSQALNTEQHLTGQGNRGQSTFERSVVDQRGSAINVTGNLALAAERDLAIVGSRIEAGGNLAAVAGNTLAVTNARNTDSGTYSAHSNTVADERQWQKDSGQAASINAGKNLNLAADSLLIEGSRVKSGGDSTLTAHNLALIATHDTETRQESYSNQGKRGGQQASLALQSDSATGSIVQAGGKLNLQSTGNATVEGSALAAGGHLALDIAGNLSLTAAQSRRQADLQRSSFNSREATALSFSQDEIRQLLGTITAGSASIKVGGDFSAATPETRNDGTLNVDRMTVNGIVKGDSRQQVSVTRTGDNADANPQNSQVLGKLAAQGIRNHSAESLAPTAANAQQTGQAALQQYLNSGLIQIAGDPQVAAQLKAQLKPDGSTLTVKDDAGNLSLTVAGQAKAQAIYNTLLLTETFDRKQFANQQTAQIVTLAAAIALTAMTGGAGSGTLGAALATAGSTGAMMINAAVIGMASTMVGQLAGGASFDQAFKAGVKAGATSALMAGVSYGIGQMVNGAAPNTTSLDTGSQNLQLANPGNASLNAVSSTGSKNLALLQSASYWQQTGLTALAKGFLSQAQGGSFKDGMLGSVIGGLAATGAGVIGDLSSDAPLTNLISHAALGCAVASAGKQDCAAGALGGAASSLIARAVGNGLKDSDLSDKTKTLIIAESSVLGATALAAVTGKNTAVAGNAAMNEVFNNYLSHEENQRRLIAARACANGNQNACAQRDALDALDKELDTKLREACYANASSPECSARYAHMTDSLNSYSGKATDPLTAKDRAAGLDQYTATSERESFKPLLNVPHSDPQAIAKATEAIKLVGNLALDMTPVIGDAKAFAEANTKLEYALAVVGALGPVGDVAKVAIKEAKLALEAGDAAKAVEKINEAEKSIAASAGSKNNWDRAINGQLEPKAVYKLDNGHQYITDASGRVSAVEGKLSLTTMDRNTYQQCATGKCGNVGDDGGHLIASSLGGAGDRINIVPQASTLNRGDWKAMENELRNELKDGKSVSVKIDVGYPAGSGVRPNEFQVFANIGGKIKEFKFTQ